MLHNEQLIYAGDAIRKAVPLEGLDGDGIPYTLMAIPVDSIDRCAAVDAIEVVRCKDCEHYDQGRCLGNHDICTEEEYWFYVNPEDYCSHGERRDVDGHEAK